MTQIPPFHCRRYSTAFFWMCVTVWVLGYQKAKNGDRGTIVFTATLIHILYCFSFELPFSLMFSSDTRKERETQLAEHVSRIRPLRLFYRVSARLSLFPKNSNRSFSFYRCGELFLLYVTSQTTKSQMVPYHLLYPVRGRREVVATVGV